MTLYYCITIINVSLYQKFCALFNLLYKNITSGFDVLLRVHRDKIIFFPINLYWMNLPVVAIRFRALILFRFQPSYLPAKVQAGGSAPEDAVHRRN